MDEVVLEYESEELQAGIEFKKNDEGCAVILGGSSSESSELLLEEFESGLKSMNMPYESGAYYVMCYVFSIEYEKQVTEYVKDFCQQRNFTDRTKK
jgi:hypothetical protein